MILMGNKVAAGFHIKYLPDIHNNNLLYFQMAVLRPIIRLHGNKQGIITLLGNKIIPKQK